MAESPPCPHCHQPNATFVRKRGVWFCGDCEREFAPPNPARAPAALDLSGLPSLLALPMRDYHRETHPVQRLWHACDVVELALRLSVTLGVAELARRGPLPDKLLGQLRPRIEEPTLGKWRGMAEAVGDHLTGDLANVLFPEALAGVDRVLVPLLDGPAKPRSPESSLSALRHQLAHGGGVTQAAARRLLVVWEPRLAEAFAHFAWMSSVQLVARAPDGQLLALRGPSPAGEPFVSPPAAAAALAAGLTQGEEVLAVRGETVLRLWPLAAFGRPRGSEAEYLGPSETPQVFSRRGEVRVHYTPIGSEEACHAEGMDSALDAFLRLFQLSPAVRRGTRGKDEIPGFEDDLRQDADRLVGRAAELASVRAALQARPEGVFWLSGPAGIGKSYLVARIATELLEEPPAGTLVLPFRFKAGDPRCHRHAFLSFVLERLRAGEGPPGPGSADAESGEGDADDPAKVRPRKPLAELRDRLGALDGRRVLLILDGLDEVAEHDPRFVEEVPLALRLPGVSWLCAGRPERGLPAAFARNGVQTLFPAGLPGMGEGDVRTMILERIGRYRRHLIAQDRDEGEQVVNAFVAKVARLAAGFPLYVTYVVGDVLGHRVSAGDAGARLPASLEKYHEELLRRCAVGVLHQVVTPLVATLAVAREPLSPEALADILVGRTLIDPARDEPLVLVRRALAAVASMLRRSVTPEGEEGYALYHHSLQQHMEASPEMAGALATARTALAGQAEDFGRRTGPAARYLFRQGLAHLVERKEPARALALLCRFDYGMARLQALLEPGAVTALLEDWSRVKSAGPAFDRPARICESFYREKGHILRRGNADWPSYKILLQLAIEHADDSPLTQGAEAWLAADRCDWVWLRRKWRPRQAVLGPCLGVLEVSGDQVDDAVLISEGRILTGSGDGKLRLWDVQTGASLGDCTGHAAAVDGVWELPGGRILSSSWDETFRVWDPSSRLCSAVLKGPGLIAAGCLILPSGRIVYWKFNEPLRLYEGVDGEHPIALQGHSAGVNAGLVLADGFFVTCSDDKTLRLWNASGAALAVFRGHEAAVGGALELSDGRILSWGEDKTLRIWDRESGQQLGVLAGHRAGIRGARRLSDGRILSWARDRTLRLWTAEVGQPGVVLEGHKEDISGALELPAGRILSWSVDKTLRLWNGATGALVAELRGHDDELRGALVLPDANILSWAWDDTLRIWEGKTGELLRCLRGHSSTVNGARVLPDGRILSWSADGTLRFWDAGLSPAIAATSSQSSERSYAFPEQRVVIKSHGRTVLVFHGDQGAPSAVLRGHADGIEGVELLPDGRILSWSWDGTLRLWNADSGELLAVLLGHEVWVEGARRLADGRILSWSQDETLRLWDGDSGREIVVLEGHSSYVTGALELADGRILSWSTDHTLRLWDGRSGAPLAVLSGHGKSVSGARELSAGRILSWSTDGTLRLWAGETGSALAVVEGVLPDISGALELADGRILAWSSDDSLRVWNGQGGHPPAVWSKQDLFRDQPELAITWLRFTGGSNVRGELELVARDRTVSLRAHLSGAIEARWQAEAPARAVSLHREGQMVVSQDADQMCLLELIRGRTPISLDSFGVVLD